VGGPTAAESSSEDEEIFGISNELKMKTLSTKAR
jgi:LPS O-antigen subunit length determinant protein (WzzB/FepE family)